MASAFMVGPGSVSTENIATTTQEAKVAPVQTVKERVSEFFKDDPIMIKVAYCESRYRQFGKDGNIFRGMVNPNDVGVMQVNTDYHLEASKKMKLDIMTLEGNLAYSRYLYEKQGTRPWNSSRPCWGNEVAMK